jgi:hypothetical protein
MNRILTFPKILLAAMASLPIAATAAGYMEKTPFQVHAHVYPQSPSIGLPADVVILELVEGPADFVDARKNVGKGRGHLKPVASVRAGRPYPLRFSHP